MYKDRESQLQAIESTFEAVKAPVGFNLRRFWSVKKKSGLFKEMLTNVKFASEMLRKNNDEVGHY